MYEQTLLQIAKNSIKEQLLNQKIIDKNTLLKEFPALSKKGAVFVTLTQNGQLRGCIGSLKATRSLLDDIISHAKNAAFEDPRFLPLSLDEFKKTKIEVSILSEPKMLQYKDIEDLKQNIQPNIHGVILELNGKSATFLPQVWEQLPNFELFFSHLCQKAGLKFDDIYKHPKIHTYTVKKIST